MNKRSKSCRQARIIRRSRRAFRLRNPQGTLARSLLTLPLFTYRDLGVTDTYFSPILPEPEMPRMFY